MSQSHDGMLEQHGWRKVATGTWFYDQKVPMRICIWAKPARDASSRFDDDGRLVESKPIPETKDGFLYCYRPGGSGEYLTIDEAKAAVNATPWGPIKWD
jgi:hypothetical protein